MGFNCFLMCGSASGSLASPKRNSVLRVVRMDGKVLEFRTSLLVKDVPLDFSGTGIAATRSSKEILGPDCELTLGKDYYMVPCATNLAASTSTEDKTGQAGAVKRVKLVITKQQLQDLLSNQVSMEDMISQLRTSTSTESPRTWKPRLDSIPEGSE